MNIHLNIGVWTLDCLRTDRFDETSTSTFVEVKNQVYTDTLYFLTPSLIIPLFVNSLWLIGNIRIITFNQVSQSVYLIVKIFQCIIHSTKFIFHTIEYNQRLYSFECPVKFVFVKLQSVQCVRDGHNKTKCP